MKVFEFDLGGFGEKEWVAALTQEAATEHLIDICGDYEDDTLNEKTTVKVLTEKEMKEIMISDLEWEGDDEDQRPSQSIYDILVAQNGCKPLHIGSTNY